MDVYSWLFMLIGKLLADAGLPAWLAEVVITALKSVLTPEKLCAVESEVRDLFAMELRKLEAANPNSVLTTELVDAICILLGSSKTA